MAVVKPSSAPVSLPEDLLSPAAPADPTHVLKLLELELARKRASRLARESTGGGRRMLPALSVLFLMILLGAAFFAVWRVQTLHDTQLPPPRPTVPTSAADPAARSR